MNVEIEIKNFGQCIPNENLPYVFEKFYRGEKSRSSHTGGKGNGACNCEKYSRTS